MRAKYNSKVELVLTTPLMVRCLQRRNDHLSKFGHVTLLASSLVYVAQVYTASSQQPEAPPCTTFTIRSLLDQRASVFDHDEFDMFHQVEHGSGVDLSQVHIGKSYKTSWSFLLLTSSSFYFSFECLRGEKQLSSWNSKAPLVDMAKYSQTCLNSYCNVR